MITPAEAASSRIFIEIANMSQCTICGAEEKRQYPANSPGSSIRCHSCLELKNLEAQIADIDLLKSNYTDDYFTHLLPPEIASHIFLLSITGPETSSDEHLRPLTLGAVSKRWREIAWSTPRLWTHVPVNLKAFFHHPKDLLLRWLERAGQLPLSIHIFYDVSESGSAQHAASFTDIFGIINEYAVRWETLSLRIPFSLYPRLRSKCDEVPLLKHIIIQSPWFIEDYAFDYRGEILDICAAVRPRPRSVTIEESPFTSIRIDWSNVTTLRFGQISVIDCLRLFRRVSRISECSINITHSWHIRRLDNPITVPHLTKLYIRFSTCNTGVASASLDSITLPALTHLKYDDTVDYTALATLLTRSSCSLANLNIRCWQDLMPPTQSLLEVLRASPSLERLRICMTQLPKDLFDFLSGPSSANASNETILLPRLQSVNYHGKLTFDWFSIKCLDSRLCIQREDGRPLLLSIDLAFYAIQLQSEPPLYYIDERAAAHIFRLVECGISVRIMNCAEDVLQYSRKFHEELGFGPVQAQALKVH